MNLRNLLLLAVVSAVPLPAMVLPGAAVHLDLAWGTRIQKNAQSHEEFLSSPPPLFFTAALAVDWSECRHRWDCGQGVGTARGH